MVKEYIFFGGKTFGRMRNYVCYMDIKKIFKYTHTYVQNKYIYIYMYFMYNNTHHECL